MTEPTIELIEPQAVPEPEASPDPSSEPDTYSADYVRELRAESAERRVKAKRVDDANARLAQAYAQQDGRLIAPSELTYGDHLLDDDGLVDAVKVSAAIDELLQAKPYLATQRPLQPIAQGVRQEVPEPQGLFSLLRERI